MNSVLLLENMQFSSTLVINKLFCFHKIQVITVVKFRRLCDDISPLQSGRFVGFLVIQHFLF